MSGKGKIPLRMCTGCREMKSKKELIRVLKTVDGAVVLDATGRMNGRGAYLCPNAECLRKALKTRALERSLGIEIPEEIVEELKTRLEALNENT